MNPRGALQAYHSEPEIRPLPQLLEEIERGRILIPRFQRPFVWRKDMRLALLDSVVANIPIGAITLWRTSSVDVATMDRFGPFILPKPEALHLREYILDGEQRLATLYSALIGAPRLSGEPTGAFDVLYDLRDRRFVTRDELDVAQPHHLPLTDLLQ